MLDYKHCCHFGICCFIIDFRRNVMPCFCSDDRLIYVGNLYKLRLGVSY
jgi:hypothetical protein